LIDVGNSNSIPQPDKIIHLFTELGSAIAISYAGASLLCNRTIFSNVIYRPRSDLLFSLELRHIRGVQQIDESSQSANHINLGMGIFF
jgi:hypothetical protein